MTTRKMKTVSAAFGLALACSVPPARAQCGILSWDAYKEVRHPLPYVLRLAAPPGELLMFGAQHTRDCDREGSLVTIFGGIVTRWSFSRNTADV